MSATVTYKGNTLTTVNNETKILETAGTWLEGDITIEDETQAESIVAEDVLNSTGVECQITGNYSGGTVTQDENGYLILSPNGNNDGEYDWSWVKDDGNTYLYIDIGEYWKTFIVKYNHATANKTVTVYWGDETTDTTTTTGIKTLSHTYTDAGSYVIKIEYEAGCVAFIADIIGGDYDAASKPMKAALRKMEYGNSYLTQNYLLRGCVNLEALAYMASPLVDIGTAYMGLGDLPALAHLMQKSPHHKQVGASNSLLEEWTFMPDAENIASMNGNRNLKKVTLGNKIKNIPSFAECYSLEEIIFTPTTYISTVLPGSAFQRCHKLKRLELPEGVSGIQVNTFYGCNSLEYLSLPSTITSIASGWNDCGSMVELHIHATTPPTLTEAAFSSFQSSAKIYVPYSADHSILSAYQSATNWSVYASMIVEEAST